VPAAGDIIAELTRRGESVCTVESLTGGLLCAALTDIPGASAVVRGGIVAYTVDAKRDVVGVDVHTLEQHGAVSEQAAEELARKGREIFKATWGISTTGVAGPTEQEGQPVGTVFVAVEGPSTAIRQLQLSGNREAIRRQTCEVALEMFRQAVEYPGPGVSLQ
jgi:nicotinamide-nucleotide amidase